MKKTKLEKGITLIALIITIVVLLILAVVTIGAIKESKIIGHALNASEDYTIGEEKEKINLAYGEYKLSKYSGENADFEVEGAEVSGNSINGWDIKFSNTGNEYELFPTGEIEKDEPIINTEDPDGWKYAWTCSEEGWSEQIVNNGNIKLPEGQGIVAVKFYEKTAKLVVEGNGNIQPPVTIDENEDLECIGYLTGLVDENGDIVQNHFMQSVKELVICDGITNIPMLAFAMTTVKKVTLPKTIETIEGGAFEGTFLEEIIIQSGSIGEGAFGAMTSLRKVTIGEGVTTIGNQAFDDCDNLGTVIIKNGVKKIGDDAFHGCSSLKSIVIPSSVTEIGKSAFEYASKLETIYIESENLTIHEYCPFYLISKNAIAYVRNDTVKAAMEDAGVKVYEKYDWKI